MNKLNRGDKIWLDKAKTKESAVNYYLGCRDGVVEAYEYSESLFGDKVIVYKCYNHKHETSALIIHHTPTAYGSGEAYEDIVSLSGSDIDKIFNGKFETIRDYSENNNN